MDAGTKGPEARLLEDLFEGYDTDARPVKNASHPVFINASFGLSHMEGLVEQNFSSNQLIH